MPARHYRLALALGALLLLMLGAVVGVLITRPSEDAAALRPRVVEEIRLGTAGDITNPSDADRQRPIVIADAAQLSAIFKTAASAVKDAVVFVQVYSSAADGGWYHNFENRFFHDQPLHQSVGSGVILTNSGYIVTNNHVVEGAERITITLGDKRQFEAEIVGVDPSTDLAVIRVENDGSLPTVTLGDSDELEVGEWVLAVGNPFRLTSTVTAGIVSALGRQVNIINEANGIEDFIQTDAAINPGNSGGALVNLDGQLVGVNTAIATETGSSEGYGFAVPVNLAKRVVADLIEYGEVRRGYLGVSVGEVTADIASSEGLEMIAGVRISEVVKNGAAHRAGIRSGDIVLTIDGVAVNETNELQSIVARRRPGQSVAIGFWREGASTSLMVTLLGREDAVTERWLAEAERPRQDDARTPRPIEPGGVGDIGLLGIGARQPSEEEYEAFDVQFGVYVAYVGRNGVSAEAGLPRDIIIQFVDGEPIESVEQLEALLQEATTERVLVRGISRHRVPVFYDIKLQVDD